jgi:hypothetical protein
VLSPGIQKDLQAVQFGPRLRADHELCGSWAGVSAAASISPL